MISSKESSGLLMYLLLYIILLVSPLYSYIKIFGNNEESKSLTKSEIILKAFKIQLVIFFILISITSGVEKFAITPDSKPSYIISTVFGDGTKNLHDYWLSNLEQANANLSSSNSTSTLVTSAEKDRVTIIGSVFILSLFLWFLSLLPPICFFLFLVLATARAYKDDPQDELASTPYSFLFFRFLTLMGATGLFIIHCWIAELYIALFINSASDNKSYSFYQLSKEATEYALGF